tara:strand:- start:309 stop:680 length:372 start_codon:yes stop_codon:yes gene_type:complete
VEVVEVPTTKLVVLVHQVVVLVEILLLLEEVIQDLPTQEQQMFPLDQTQHLLNGLAILVVKDRHRRAVIILAVVAVVPVMLELEDIQTQMVLVVLEQLIPSLTVMKQSMALVAVVEEWIPLLV